MNYKKELVGAGRFELPVSCSQSRRASHYATPRGAMQESRRDFTPCLPTQHSRPNSSTYSGLYSRVGYLRPVIAPSELPIPIHTKRRIISGIVLRPKEREMANAMNAPANPLTADFQFFMPQSCTPKAFIWA